MKLPALKIGELVSKLPIIQGGMGVGISMSKLASAVAKEGGIGVIAAAMQGIHEPDIIENSKEANIRVLRQEIRKARANTRGVLGVNIMVALTNFADMVRTAIEEKIDKMIAEKTKLSNDVIESGGEAWITEMDNHQIVDLFTLSL